MTTNNLVVFDLDHTLINADSDVLWISYLHDKGIVDDAFLDKRDDFFQKYVEGTLDIGASLTFILSPLARFSCDELDIMHAEFLHNYIVPTIYKDAQAIIKKHQDAGDDVLIISATNEFIVTPIAHHLGVAESLGIQLETNEQGNYTGDYCGVPSFQAGKITRLDMWLDARGKTYADYQETYFYSDSINDLPLLEKVSKPIATNPDNKLKEIAEKSGWEVLDFS